MCVHRLAASLRTSTNRFVDLLEMFEWVFPEEEQDQAVALRLLSLEFCLMNRRWQRLRSVMERSHLAPQEGPQYTGGDPGHGDHSSQTPRPARGL